MELEFRSAVSTATTGVGLPVEHLGYDLIVADDENFTDELLNATGQLIDALREAQGALEHLVEGVAEVRSRVVRGEEIDMILRSSDLDEYRRVVDEGMEKFEIWRRIARGSAIRAAIASGMTLTEIAEEFGFSRTYARRLAREEPPIQSTDVD